MSKRKHTQLSADEDVTVPKRQRTSVSSSNDTKKKNKNISYNEGIWDAMNTNSPQTDSWVSGTAIKNYLLKDPLLDWLELYYVKYEYNTNPQSSSQTPSTTPPQSSLPIDQPIDPPIDPLAKRENQIKSNKNKMNYLFQMGFSFEDKIMEYFKSTYPNDTIQINTATETCQQDATLQAMTKGIPIILQAPLCNTTNNTRGIADIIMRSDWLKRIFTITTQTTATEKTSSAITKDYHYVIIDIKCTTMQLCANKQNIRNAGRFYCYKGQLAIYNYALGVLQGYIPQYAYIMAKGWNMDDKEYGHSCFERLGVIDYNGFDKTYIQQTRDAIDWIRNVRANGHTWSCNPPTVPELYPNMCNKMDEPYTAVKKDLATKLKELTSIWMIGPKHREIAFQNGIFSYTDERCNSMNIGINGPKISKVVDGIISINQSDGVLLSPDTIKNNTHCWQTPTSDDFYVDIEFINNCFTKHMNIAESKSDITIFMIGIGWHDEDGWQYMDFTIEYTEQELTMIDNFCKFVDTRSKTPRFFHWGHVEESTFRRLNIPWFQKVIWIDMCRIFIDEPITVKNAKSFGLKEITNAMNKNGMINISWSSDGPCNGFDAMIQAFKYYKSMDKYKHNPSDNKKLAHYTVIMENITKYNEIDCQSIHEIVAYLRKNHI